MHEKSEERYLASYRNFQISLIVWWPWISETKEAFIIITHFSGAEIVETVLSLFVSCICVLLLLSCRSSLYTNSLDTRPTLGIRCANASSHFGNCLFSFVMVSFEANLLIWWCPIYLFCVAYSSMSWWETVALPKVMKTFSYGLFFNFIL